MRRGHATRLPKPPYADSRRHPGVNASIFARTPRGNRHQELSAILSLCLWRPAGRSQSCLHTPIRTPVSLHRNLPAEVLRRPIESANTGWVSVGTDHDTAAFAVNAIRRWWKAMGKKRYPKPKGLLVTADGGGSNGYRVRLWKIELQKLADELKFPITVCHLPPGTSKWNKIEHR